MVTNATHHTIISHFGLYYHNYDVDKQTTKYSLRFIIDFCYTLTGVESLLFNSLAPGNTYMLKCTWSLLVRVKTSAPNHYKSKCRIIVKWTLGSKLQSNYYRNSMMTSSNGNIFRVTGPLCGEFTGPGEFPAQRPVTRSFDVLFDPGLNKQLSKQLWGWWFGSQSCSLWRHCNAIVFIPRKCIWKFRLQHVGDFVWVAMW